MTARPLIQPAILSGGAGTRLWPMSRAAKPKQFIALVTRRSLFQETVLRVRSDEAVECLAPIVICGAAHVAIIEEQLAAIDIEPAAIIAEPMPRNTAAAASVAAEWTRRHAERALTLLTPADHTVADARAFRRAIASGARAADKGAIVTLGVKPSGPHTGFGYIEAGAPIAEGVAEIRAFREKPDAETAQAYVEGGRHYWNAGVFLFAPEAMLTELAAHAPAIRAAALRALDRATKSGAIIELDTDSFAACPADSIDYAVMEKTGRAAIVGPLDAGWSDIGSWTALDSEGDDGQVAAFDCENVLIRTDGPFVGAVGLKDVVIVATGDAVLVAARDKAEDVKRIVAELKARGRHDLL